jgi:RNA 2',3'-cyclic 3'-phosphodiesterase
MAFLGIRVPNETARLFKDVDVPGTKEPPSSMHITLLFLGDNIPIETLAKAMVATIGVTSNTPPFTVATDHVTCFPTDDNVPVICPIESKALHELQAKIRKAYDNSGIKYSKKHPEYKPHLTLAYADEEIEKRSISKVEWGAHEIVLWGGDEGDSRLVITFPLSLDASKTSGRVLQRYLGNPLPESN